MRISDWSSDVCSSGLDGKRIDICTYNCQYAMFEWDEAKNLANIRKHGVPFEYACDVFKGPIWVSEDTRKAYGEPRWQAIGELLGRSEESRVGKCVRSVRYRWSPDH